MVLAGGCSGHLQGHLQEYHKVGPQPQITHIADFAFGWVWVGWTWFGHGQNQARQDLVIAEIRMGLVQLCSGWDKVGFVFGVELG